MISLIVAAVLSMQAIDRDEPPSVLERPEILAAAGARLADPARERPFSILMIGDSHSAADHISGALRERLQAEYGQTARGVLQPASPFAGHSVRQASVTYEGVVSLGGGDGDQAAGLTGFIGRASSGASISISAEPVAAFDAVTVCFLSEPGAGLISLESGQGQSAIDASATTRVPKCETIPLANPETLATLRISSGPVRLFSIATTRSEGGGLSVSNLGVIGAQVRSLMSRDSRVLAAELSAYQPDLILLAFGTNEGFDDGLIPSDYAATYAEALALLQRLAPEATVVAIGAPDAATLRPDLYRQGGFDRYDLCFPLSDAERADYPARVAARDELLARWYAPPSLDVVREIQRQAARSAGVAFWDWEARMGGPCAIDRMLRADLPAARSDHVHFTRAGGDLIGGWLADDLLAAMSGEAD